MRPLTNLLLVGFFLTSLTRLALCQPTDVGLVAHWKFDESSGTTAHDVTGHYDGQLTATGASFDTNGIAGNALKLDRAQNGYVIVTNLVGLVTNDFSVVVWVKLAPGDTTPATYLISKHEAWYENGFFVVLNQYGGANTVSKASFLVNDIGHIATSTSSINDGQWHQIVGVYGKGGQMAVYVDGSPAEASIASPSVIDRSAPFIIGGLYGNVTTGVPNGYVTGWIDDVQLYSQVLTDSQIDALFHNPGKNLVDLQASLIISPAGGAFVGSVDVTLTATVAGTTIRYTLDGSDPVATSPAYSTPITLTGTTTVKARLFFSGYPVSEVVSATFTASPAITFNPPGGLFTNSVQVTMINNLGLGSILYTSDGSDPVTNSTPYTAPVTLTSAATLKARVFLNGFPASEIDVASYARVYALNDGIPSSWREHYFGPGYLTDPRAAADADPDGDGYNNLIEYQSGTDPTDKNSHPEIVVGIRGIPLVSWNSIPGLTYQVLRKPSVSATNWDIVLPAFKAAATNSQYIDVGAPATSVYMIELLP